MQISPASTILHQHRLPDPLVLCDLQQHVCDVETHFKAVLKSKTLSNGGD